MSSGPGTTEEKPRIFHVSSSETLRKLRDDILRINGFEVESTLSYTSVVEAVSTAAYDLVLIDVDGETRVKQAVELCDDIKTCFPTSMWRTSATIALLSIATVPTRLSGRSSILRLWSALRGRSSRIARIVNYGAGSNSGADLRNTAGSARGWGASAERVVLDCVKTGADGLVHNKRVTSGAAANPTRSWKRLDGVDVLRGLAIFFVLMNHVNMRLLGAKSALHQGSSAPARLLARLERPIWGSDLLRGLRLSHHVDHSSALGLALPGQRASIFIGCDSPASRRCSSCCWPYSASCISHTSKISSSPKRQEGLDER